VGFKGKGVIRTTVDHVSIFTESSDEVAHRSTNVLNVFQNVVWKI
jgi:hypothetical protein